MDNQFSSKGGGQSIGSKQVNSFFGTLLKKKVPRGQWDSKLREIAGHYKELLMVKLKAEAQLPEDKKKERSLYPMATTL